MGNSSKKPQINIIVTLIDELSNLFNETHLLKILEQYHNFEKCYYFNKSEHLMSCFIERQMHSLTFIPVIKLLHSKSTRISLVSPESVNGQIFREISVDFIFSKTYKCNIIDCVEYFTTPEFSHINVNNVFLIKLYSRIMDIKICGDLLFIFIEEHLFGALHDVIIFKIDKLIKACLIIKLFTISSYREHPYFESINGNEFQLMKIKRCNLKDQLKRIGNLIIN